MNHHIYQDSVTKIKYAFFSMLIAFFCMSASAEISHDSFNRIESGAPGQDQANKLMEEARLSFLSNDSGNINYRLADDLCFCRSTAYYVLAEQYEDVEVVGHISIYLKDINANWEYHVAPLVRVGSQESHILVADTTSGYHSIEAWGAEYRDNNILFRWQPGNAYIPTEESAEPGSYLKSSNDIKDVILNRNGKLGFPQYGSTGEDLDKAVANALNLREYPETSGAAELVRIIHGKNYILNGQFIDNDEDLGTINDNPAIKEADSRSFRDNDYIESFKRLTNLMAKHIKEANGDDGIRRVFNHLYPSEHLKYTGRGYFVGFSDC